MTTAPVLERGRIVQYRVRVVPTDPVRLNFPHAATLIEVVRETTSKKTSRQSTGRRLFVCSRPGLSPSEALALVRRRWGIENRNHHPRIAAFLENKCRCLTANTAANLALLRGAVLIIWKSTSPTLPAAAFTSRCLRKLDATIKAIRTNQ